MRQAFLPAWLLFYFVITSPTPAQQQPQGRYVPREGDMVFQSLPHGALVDAIEGASGSPFSHCGIVHLGPDGWLVIEAIGPVKETPLVEWVGQGRDGLYAVTRFKAAYAAVIPDFVKAAQGYEGLPYDIHYDMRNEAAMYCSGLLYKAFLKAKGEPLGRLQRLGELNWKPYVRVILEIENGKVPLDLVLVTPASVYEATQVEKVYSNYR